MKRIAILTLLCSLSPFLCWANSHDQDNREICSTFLTHLAISSKLAGGPYPAQLRRDFKREGRILLSISYKIENENRQPELVLILKEFPSDTRKLFLQTIEADLKMANRNFSLFNYRRENPDLFLLASGMRGPDELGNSHLFREITRILEQRLEKTQHEDVLEFPRAAETKNPELKF